MNERETTTFTSEKTGDVYVIKTYITGREKRALQEVYFKEAGDFDDESTKLSLKGRIYQEAQNLALKTVIVSINGHKDGDTVNDKPFSVLDYVLELPSAEFDSVNSKIQVIVDGEQKKTI